MNDGRLRYYMERVSRFLCLECGNIGNIIKEMQVRVHYAIVGKVPVNQLKEFSNRDASFLLMSIGEIEFISSVFITAIMFLSLYAVR